MSNITYEKKNNVLLLNTEQGIILLSFAGDSTLRFRWTKSDSFVDEEYFILDGAPNCTEFDLAETNNELIMHSSKVKVKVNLINLGLIITDKRGKEILTTPIDFLSSKKEEKTVRFNLENDEKIYGLGQDPMANLNQKDKERRMWNQFATFQRSSNVSVPFMMSSNGYGILMNSPWSSRFAVGKAEVGKYNKLAQLLAPAPWLWDNDSGETHPDKTSIILDGGDMDLFIILHDDYGSILKEYHKLTGFPALIPKWALGYIQCRNRYRSQKELIETAKEFRRRNIACDVLVIDWLWFKEFGDLQWVKEEWPDPKAMTAELKSMGIKVMQAQHPYIKRTSATFEAFNKQGFLNKLPDKNIENGYITDLASETTPTFDHTNPKAREAWWDKIREFYHQGIKGYWTDMGEIEQHFPGTESYMGTREKVHNLYSLLWAKGLYDGQRSESNERVFSLHRTAYAGSQKYGAALWSGDIDSTWQELKEHVVVGQGACLSGLNYWATDIGGFFCGQTGFDGFHKKLEFTPELFIRWFQWGVFCPLFRTHGTRPNTEPWSFGEQAEQILDKFIKLRYRLMPYIYNCVHDAHINGAPIMRPMFYHYPNDAAAENAVSQYMFGEDILVAPITKKGGRLREVYLPDGEWYDFWTDKKHIGQNAITIDAPLDNIPLFIRAGAVIPMTEPQLSVDDIKDDKIILHLYAGKEGECKLYEDDGISYDYERGIFTTTSIKYIGDAGKVIIDKTKGKGQKQKSRTWEIVLHSDNKSAALAVEDLTPEEAKIVDIAQLTECCKEKSDEKSALFKLDYDMDTDGITTINLMVTPKSDDDAENECKAELTLPQGWEYSGLIPPDNKKKGKGSIHYSWTICPYSEVLPVINKGVVSFKVNDETKKEITFDFGYGYITRWNMLGSFSNNDNEGIVKNLAIEDNFDVPFVISEGRKMCWSRDKVDEFNSMGYVNARKLGLHRNDKNIANGIGYSKCRVWSECEKDVYLNVSAEKEIKLWVNDKVELESRSMLINHTSMQPVKIKEGWNTLIVKSAVYCAKPSAGREYGFNLRLLDDGMNVDRALLYMP